MKLNFDVLQQCPLFQDLSMEDIKHIVNCFDMQLKSYSADDYLLLTGEELHYVGIVISGCMEILKEDAAGNRYMVAMLHPSDLFGEGIVCTRNRISPVSVRTREASMILSIPYQKIIAPCTNACHFHSKLIYNMMLILGEKNYLLNHKIEILMLKGMREKLATFLLNESNRQHALLFSIPMNRNELAEYLNVSRPSMSRELGRMKEEGIIDYHKNTFHILKKDKLLQILSF